MSFVNGLSELLIFEKQKSILPVNVEDAECISRREDTKRTS